MIYYFRSYRVDDGLQSSSYPTCYFVGLFSFHSDIDSKVYRLAAEINRSSNPARPFLRCLPQQTNCSHFSFISFLRRESKEEKERKKKT